MKTGIICDECKEVFPNSTVEVNRLSPKARIVCRECFNKLKDKGVKL